MTRRPKEEKRESEAAPQFDDVLKRMLSSPPAPHPKPKPKPAAEAAQKKPAK